RKKMEGTKEFTLHRRRRYEAELVEIIRKRLMKMIFDEDVFRDRVEDLIDMIMRKKKDPYSAADEILSQVLK
ncbi:MAG: methylmalonyl Co-A mutase-associated GTPase MeaB, partial [Thermotoga sp.]